MPNRILKETICVSDKIDRLSWFAEALFYRLIVNCDDYGRSDGRGAVLRARLFPLKDEVTVEQVERALGELCAVGCVRRYEAEGEKYLLLTGWDRHQRIRARRSRFPGPDGEGLEEAFEPFADNGGHPLSSADNGGHPRTSAVKCRRNPIQSESESESKSESESESESCAHDSGVKETSVCIDQEEEPETAAEESARQEKETLVCYNPLDLGDGGNLAGESPDSAQGGFDRLPLRGGGEFVLGEQDAQDFRALYPDADLALELRRMRGWLLANPDKRKNARRIKGFVNGWLDRAQQSSAKPGAAHGGAPPGSKPSPSPNLQNSYAQRAYDNQSFEHFFAKLE